MRKMNHFKLLAVICAMTLFASCNFEEINTNQFEMSDGEGAMDGFEVGGLITAMQRTVIPVGTQADDTDVINEYQIAYHLSADNWSGFFGENNSNGWNAGSNNTTYYLLDNWIKATYTQSYTNALDPWKKLKIASEKNGTPEVFALAQILKISAWHKTLESFGPMPYSHAADATMNIPFDSEKEVYTAMFEELTAAIEELTEKAYDKSRPRVPVLTNQIPGNVKYVDMDGNGEINSDDMVPYGSNDPDLTYGFTNRFSYKNLELSVFLRGQIGGKVLYLAGRSLDTGRGNYNGLKRWLHAYKEEYAGGNPIPTSLGVDMSWDGKTPLPYGLGNNSPLNKDGQMHMTDMAIYNASFLRIQNISLTYKLPKKWLRKSHIQAAKVYVTAENLYTFTDYIGNPDVNSYSPDNPMVRGADYTTYPQSRKYIFGVNLTF